MSRLYDVGKLCKNSKERWDNLVKELKVGVFGYKCGLPGEEEWLKPLKGPSRNKWYWPSKYLHLDFTLRHYISMQINRFKPKYDDPAIYELWETVSKIKQHKDVIRRYLESIDEDTFLKSTTLQDTHSLYKMIHEESPLKFQYDTNVDYTKYRPYIDFALNCERQKVVDISATRIRNRLRTLLKSNKALKECLMTRNRFVDGLYMRRRAYYLDKVIRKKPMSDTQVKYKSHFHTHPDDKEIWPDNKGITQHRWPSR